jgi:CheY-like chemotaxis protein
MSLPPCDLLIVDDEAAVRFSLSDYFEQLGYSVRTAATVAEARAMLATCQPRVVLTDLRLTDLDQLGGLSVVRAAREAAPSAKIVLLSAFRTPEVEAEARRYGAALVLWKPVPLAHLAEYVENAGGH